MIVDLTANTSAADELSRRDELAERLRWLINLRWLALLGVAAVIATSRALVVSVWPLAGIAAAMAVLNLGFHGLHSQLQARTLRALSAEALLQTAVDVIGLGLLLFFAGGLTNPFVFYFTFHVVIAAILLEKRQAYTVALLTAGVVIFLGLADELGLNAAWPLEGALKVGGRLSRFGLVFAVGTTLLISVYMVTAIMERLRTHSRDVRRLNADLAERVEMLAAAEKKLAAEHQRARAILECMEEGVVVVDLRGKVLLANTAAQKSALLALGDTLEQAGCHAAERAECRQQVLAGEKKLGPGEECPLGSPAACLQDVLSKGGKLCPATLALLGADPPVEPDAPLLAPPAAPKLAQIEMQGRRFENTVSAVRTEPRPSGSGEALGDGETLGLVIVSRDVTERRSLERQAGHAEKLHALGNLAAGLAHELNTPLGTILGYAQMLLDDDAGRMPAPHNAGRMSAPQRRELAVIEEQARRCRKIVQGLLDFARKSSGGRAECAPNDLAVKARDLLAHTLDLRGIALRLDLCDPPPPKIHVAVDEIEQVLVNLITNAADAIELSAGNRGQTGRPVCPLFPAVTVQTRADAKGEVLIAVEDDGPGVAPELAEQVFEPFFTTKEAGRGTGLGLSIALRIVEDHNGSLRLTPRPDGSRGARFEVRLPMSPPLSTPEREIGDRQDVLSVPYFPFNFEH